MKKKKPCILIVGLLVVALMVGGCAFLQGVKDFVCNPTEAQKADAAKMLAALDAAQAAGAIFAPEIAIIKASAVLTTIQRGGCFLIAELEEVFKILDSVDTAKMKAKGLKVEVDTYPSLRKLLRK